MEGEPLTVTSDSGMQLQAHVLIVWTLKVRYNLGLFRILSFLLSYKTCKIFFLLVQVCAILWSSEYKEIISGHGFSQNQLTIWKYPLMSRVTELTGHTSRVLHMTMSPDRQFVASVAADETLRIWKCFARAQKQKKASRGVEESSNLMSSMKLR